MLFRDALWNPVLVLYWCCTYPVLHWLFLYLKLLRVMLNMTIPALVGWLGTLSCLSVIPEGIGQVYRQLTVRRQDSERKQGGE